uniref:Uncharacterized protein n=1 Tax=Ananas comosus var. bracteatus TaxID=296719 RepID=A0A6V7QVA9_ANACO
MEDYLARLLNLTSYISHSIIQFIGDLVFGNVERISCDPKPSFSGWRGRTLHSIDHPSRRETSMFPDYSDSITEVNRSWTVVLCRAKLFICRGLMFGLKLGAKFVAAGFKHGHFYIKGLKVRAHGFIRRLRRTLQGSTEDIGWLQRVEGLPPVEDGTARFKEILCDVRNGVHRLPNTLVYLFIPGLFSNHSPLYFANTKRFFSKMGLTCHIAKFIAR